MPICLTSSLTLAPEPESIAQAVEREKGVRSSPTRRPHPAYFECTSCGARFSHVRLNRVRPGPWNDASDASFDKYYDGTTPGSINKRRVAALRESVEATVPAPSPRTYQGHVLGLTPSAPSGGREGSVSPL